MKKLKLILSSLLLTVILNAQTPGYLGKKFMVGYNFNFNPVTSIGLFTNELMDAPLISLAIKHEGNVGYTFSKKGLFYASYIYQNNKTYYSFGDDIDYYDGTNYDMFQKVKTTVIDFGMKVFIGKFIAPVGTYFDLGYGICKAGFSDNPAKIYYSDFGNFVPGNPSYYDATDSYLKYKRFSIGVGNTKVINDFLFFNIGLKLNINHNYEYFVNRNVVNASTKPLFFIENSVKSTNYMEIKIGFGILI